MHTHFHPTRRSILRYAASACCIGVGSAIAVAARPAELPAELRGTLDAARWSGDAQMTFFGLDIYEANLWVAPSFDPAAYAKAPFALELRYQRSLYGKAIAQRALQEMTRIGPISDAQQQNWLAAMQNAFPDVQAGDRIVGLHQPGTGARFWHNAKPRATVPDPEFSRYFFGIWLAATSSEPAMRTRLLQQAQP